MSCLHKRPKRSKDEKQADQEHAKKVAQENGKRLGKSPPENKMCKYTTVCYSNKKPMRTSARTELLVVWVCSPVCCWELQVNCRGTEASSLPGAVNSSFTHRVTTSKGRLEKGTSLSVHLIMSTDTGNPRVIGSTKKGKCYSSFPWRDHYKKELQPSIYMLHNQVCLNPPLYSTNKWHISKNL